MIFSSESFNKMFNSLAKFASGLTGREVQFPQVKHGEPWLSVTVKMDKFFEDASEVLNNPAIKMLGVLEPGKTYVLQIDPDTVNWDDFENLADDLKDKDITIVVIDKDVNFVSVPDGYEMVKKDNS